MNCSHRHRSQFIAAWLGVGLLVLWTNQVDAHGLAKGIFPDIPKHDIAFGPSLAYARADQNGYAVNFDLSYSYAIFSASTNLKLLRFGSQTSFGPQFEATVWYGANVGGGAGYLFGNTAGGVWHLFAGVPLGTLLPRVLHPFETVYVEPYYRANFFYPSGLRVIHEVGLLIKVTTFCLGDSSECEERALKP